MSLSPHVSSPDSDRPICPGWGKPSAFLSRDETDSRVEVPRGWILPTPSSSGGFGDISEPDGPRLAGTLSLWRSTESVGAIPANPAVPTLPDGAEGRLYGGSDGSWGIVWVDPFPSPYDDPCSETTLSLDMPNLSSARQREELFQVARSLEHA